MVTNIRAYFHFKVLKMQVEYIFHSQITLPTHNGVVDVSFQGKTYHAGDSINVQLQQFQTIQIQSTGDLSGNPRIIL